jgi:hypothetical protein
VNVRWKSYSLSLAPPTLPLLPHPLSWDLLKHIRRSRLKSHPEKVTSSLTMNGFIFHEFYPEKKKKKKLS